MTDNYGETVSKLADMAGILPFYQTDDGVFETSEATNVALLQALGYNVSTPENAEKTLAAEMKKPFETVLPPVLVVRNDEKTAEVPVTFKSGVKENTPVKYEMTLEDGTVFNGETVVSEMPVADKIDGFEHRLLRVSIPEKAGYHTLTVHTGNKDRATMNFIVAPRRCYLPESMEKGKKPWGFPVQLYALRSETDWGIGDFSSLKEMMRVAAGQGADIVGINPINVAFLSNVETASPYYSSTRLFLNPLYIDVTAVAESKSCESLQKYLKTKSFKDALQQARQSKTVDYTAVWSLKSKALEMLYACFSTAEKSRLAAFDSFCQAGGADLENAALYQALAEHFCKLKKSFGFRSWGADYSSPDKPKVKAFSEKNKDRVRYFKYLFWLADEQFAVASAESAVCGLDIGIYQDLAVGVASESAETWGNQGLFATSLSIGSPPDMFNAKGQSWGVAPMKPAVMRSEAYQSYRKMLEANMKRAGAVRIDHVMGLTRLFCIPADEKGAYLGYPMADMMGIVALESHRNKCLVVGEDLGIVPSFFREALRDAGILSFRVFRYEQGGDGRYTPLEYYPDTALVAAGTHDMPTLTGYWTENDIDMSEKIGLLSDPEKAASLRQTRLRDRRAMVEALAKKGIWFMSRSDFDDEIKGKKMPPALCQALYAHLAAAPCKLLLAQLEDILGQTEQMNMPGTNSEYPNWRFKLPLTLKEMNDSDTLKNICSIIKKARNG